MAFWKRGNDLAAAETRSDSAMFNLGVLLLGRREETEAEKSGFGKPPRKGISTRWPISLCCSNSETISTPPRSGIGQPGRKVPQQHRLAGTSGG
jgi:hypothetical protein